MPKKVPRFNDKAIVNIALELYGIEGKVSSLVSFEDQNALIKTSNGKYVLKFANKRWPVGAMHMQTEVLELLSSTLPHLDFPKMVKTKSGETTTFVDGFAVRMLTYIDGNTFGHGKKPPELYRSLGSFLGQFTQAMEGYRNPVSIRPDDYWNLDNVLACKGFLQDVVDDEVRACIARYFIHYEKNTGPKIQNLRKSVIHNDVNEYNILVPKDGSSRVKGLIDFGDLMFATHINELAIAIAYALLGEDEIEASAFEMVKGYNQEFKLEADEVDVLFDLVAMRLINSIVMSSKGVKEFPDNKYILISQKPARILLQKLDRGKIGLDFKNRLGLGHKQTVFLGLK